MGDHCTAVVRWCSKAPNKKINVTGGKARRPVIFAVRQPRIEKRDKRVLRLSMKNDNVIIVPYDPNWLEIYERESKLIQSTCGIDILKIEHIGSTSITGQKAKPIIDMMAAVGSVDASSHLLNVLEGIGYEEIQTGMRERIFLRKRGIDDLQFYHFHLVNISSWGERKERIMRDYLKQNPTYVREYGVLKERLSQLYPDDDSLEYTKAKTDFIQNLMDKACDKLGRPKIDVWND